MELHKQKALDLYLTLLPRDYECCSAKPIHADRHMVLFTAA